MSDWGPDDEAKHPRGKDGRFTDSWAQRLVGRIRPHRVQTVDSPQEAKRLAALLGPSDDPRTATARQALMDRVEMPDYVETSVAWDDQDRLVGAMSVTTRENVAMIENIGALEHSGAGRFLVNWAIARAETQGVEAIYLDPTDTAEGFWERIGFRPDPMQAGHRVWGLPAAEFESWRAQHGY